MCKKCNQGKNKSVFLNKSTHCSNSYCHREKLNKNAL